MESNERYSSDQSDELWDNSEDSPAKKQRVSQDVEDSAALVSQSETNINEQLNTQVLNELECPVCYETCLPPIFMCDNGHISCAKCRPQLAECSLCRTDLPLRRCVPLERVAALLIYPCPNKPYGCMQMLQLDEMSEHTPKCEYGLKCFMCEMWTGCGKDMKIHMQMVHPEICKTIPSTGCVVRQRLSTGTDFQSHFGVFLYIDNMFWSEGILSDVTQSYFMTMRIASNDVEKASRYIFSVKFEAKNLENSCKVFIRDVVQPMNRKGWVQKIKLPESIIDSYEDGFVEYTLKISVN